MIEIFKILFVPSIDDMNRILQGAQGDINEVFDLSLLRSSLVELGNMRGDDNFTLDIYVPLLGREITIVDFSFILESRQYYFPIIRGFALVLLIFGTFDQLYKIIRGVSLFGAHLYINEMAHNADLKGFKKK